MGNHKKTQEGVFIALFALSTLVVLGLAIGFMSNTVNDLLAGQGQVMAGKQSYWLAYSGMEITSTNRFAGITAEENEYTLEGGKITTLGTNVGAGKFNGADITDVITSTGAIADGSRQMKWTLENPTNYALSFDGDDDHVTLIDAAAFTFDGQITFSAWVIRDITNAGHVIISKWDETSGSEKREWAFLMEANRGPKLSIYKESDDSNLTKDVDSSPSTGVWHHLAATYDGTSVIKLYVDGVEQSVTTQTSSGSVPYQIENQTTIAAIGARTESNGNPGSFMNGMIDEVTLWNTALSTAQVQSLYIQGRVFDTNSIASGSVVGYWKLENNANDSSGNSRNGTKNGATYSGI